MAVKIKLANKRPTDLRHRVLRAFAAAVLICVVLGAIVFGYFYLKYQRIVDARLAAGPIFANVAQIYAAPREVRVGQHMSAEEIAQDLRRAGYNANPQLGTFQLEGNTITIKPGPESYTLPTAAQSQLGTPAMIAVRAELPCCLSRQKTARLSRHTSSSRS